MKNVIYTQDAPDCTDDLHAKVFATHETNVFLLWIQIGQNNDGMYDSETMLAGYSLGKDDIISYADELVKKKAIELMEEATSLAFRNLSDFD